MTDKADWRRAALNTVAWGAAACAVAWSVVAQAQTVPAQGVLPPEVESALARSKLPRDAISVLVAEAARPSGDLISARKGNAKYRIRFHGKASHAGSALAEGVSAITELAHWVLAINEQVNMETGTTMNVGVVQGGTGVNVVPDFAEAIVDLRFWSNDEAAAVHERLGFMANNPFLRGCRVEVDRQSFKPAMRPSGDTEALMALVEAAATIGAGTSAIPARRASPISSVSA
mgnify:CR=1 FL=1